jgi:serine/threonine protein phosphatase PrpC
MHKTRGPFKIGTMVTQLSETKTKWRPYMEDFSFTERIVLPRIDDLCIYGVCDGHGGKSVSYFIFTNIKNLLEEGLSELQTPKEFLNKGLMTKILQNCFAILESRLEKLEDIRTVGSTCSMVLCSPSLNVFYAINCGDSSVFGIGYDSLNQLIKVSRITSLHKPDQPNEQSRIQKAGGFVTESDIPRLCGILAVSRSLGDFDLRKYGLTEVPDVFGPLKLVNSLQSSNKTDTFIGFIIMSDGITDYITEDEIQQLLNKNFKNRLTFANILRESTDSQDNASVITAFMT